MHYLYNSDEAVTRNDQQVPIWMVRANMNKTRTLCLAGHLKV